MTVETTQPSGEPAATDSTEPTVAAAEPTVQPRTVEEVEAEWQKRISGKDKAHAEETKVLREQLGRYTAAEEERRRTEEATRQQNMTADQRMQDQITTLTRQLDEQEKAHLVEMRRTRFPTVATELDDAVLAVADEAKLASLEAKLRGQAASPPSLIDQNSVARSANGATPTGERTVAELEAELKSQEPAFIAELQAR